MDSVVPFMYSQRIYIKQTFFYSRKARLEQAFTFKHNNTHFFFLSPAATAPPVHQYLGVPLCTATQARNSVTNDKMRCNYFEAVTCWASAEWSWETCVALGLHYRCAAVHFTVARQRLTLCNQIVCWRVSHCASVMWMGLERVGSRAVRWVVVSDRSVVKNKPLAIVTGNGPRYPLLCCCHPPSSQGLSHNITIFFSSSSSASLSVSPLVTSFPQRASSFPLQSWSGFAFFLC